MAIEGPRRVFSGDIPEPPSGEPTEVARAAWRMAYRAERIAINANDRSSALFETLGEMARKFTEEITRRVDGFNERFDKLELRLDGVRPQLDAVAYDAKEARTSSHDLSEEVEKIESILAEIKTKAVDSIRVKQLVVEEHQVLVTKQELERLQRREAEAEEDRKLQATEKRNYKLTTRGLIVSGIVVAFFAAGLTYAMTRAPAPAPATLTAPSH